ncbi:GvpL/GvpF family gas vesicle protein [Amycolatopsis pigmentata]|uniref:GvpL/GvpF family gas vesicle protein n=1 Tax=Amycolatopsis pigmentata TaxID=450801 RepID=A0ABW5G0X1_9PSEU
MPETSTGTTTTTGCWLYAVTREVDRRSLESSAGVAGEPLRTVESAGLIAVLGTVPLDSFGEEALHRNLEDLDWLSRVARAHDAVVDKVARRSAAVPLRLATVYLDDERVRATLEARERDFARALDRVTGRTEWGVKALVEPSHGGEPELAAKGSGQAKPGAGAAYLRRRREQMTAREQGERVAVEQAERAHAVLARLAAANRLHPPQSRQLSGDTNPMILNAAYLVDEAAAREFTRAVAALDDELDAIRLQLTGPWPPYSFAALEETP